MKKVDYTLVLIDVSKTVPMGRRFFEVFLMFPYQVFRLALTGKFKFMSAKVEQKVIEDMMDEQEDERQRRRR